MAAIRRTVRRIDISKFALVNKIEWYDSPDIDVQTSLDFFGTVDISRSVVPDTDTYTQVAFSMPLNQKIFLDQDIDMNKRYTYRLSITHTESSPPEVSGDWKTSITSYNPKINNTNVTYTYTNNSFNITWNALNTEDFFSIYGLTPFAVKNYQIFICKKSINNDLILFETTNNSDTNITINTGASGQSESGNSENFDIVNGLYFFYIAPVLQDTTTNPVTIRFLSLDNFKNNDIFAEPHFKLNINPETPGDFKITSPYNNGKISFSWKSSNPIPNKYILTFTNTTINTSITKNVTSTNYVLDNSDLTSNDALQPGIYTVSILSSYNNNDSIQSPPSSNLTFTIPVTNIEFTKKLIDSQGEIVTNDVAGIQLDWNKLGYATYYKINVKQYNENLILQSPDLDYHVAHPTNSIQFAWNFPNEKSVFEFRISYTTDSFSPPNIEDLDALGESYLGVSGTNYPVLLNNASAGAGPPLGQVPIPEGG